MKRLSQTAVHHDLMCLSVRDPREVELPNVGKLVLEDRETGELLEVDTRKSRVREQFNVRNQERLEHNRKAFRKSGIDLLELETGGDYSQTVVSIF